MGRTSDADERLKDAALALIWEESYGAVTIDDICKRAEVKKGSFYYFFESKAELAVAALEKMWADPVEAQFGCDISLFGRTADAADNLPDLILSLRRSKPRPVLVKCWDARLVRLALKSAPRKWMSVPKYGRF